MSAAGCAAPGTTASHRAAVADSVEQVWAAMMTAFSARDPAGIRAGYVPHPIVALNGSIIDDFDDRFAETARWVASLREAMASYDDVHVDVLGQSAAVATMTHHLRWIDSTGTPGAWRSAWTAVFRRTAGGWKIAYTHESTSMDAR